MNSHRSPRIGYLGLAAALASLVLVAPVRADIISLPITVSAANPTVALDLDGNGVTDFTFQYVSSPGGSSFQVTGNTSPGGGDFLPLDLENTVATRPDDPSRALPIDPNTGVVSALRPRIEFRTDGVHLVLSAAFGIEHPVLINGQPGVEIEIVPGRSRRPSSPRTAGAPGSNSSSGISLAPPRTVPPATRISRTSRHLSPKTWRSFGLPLAPTAAP